RREPRAVAGEADVGRQLALKHLAREQELSTFVLEANAVADNAASHGRNELRNKIAHLIRMRHEHQPRLLRAEEPLQPGSESIGSVRLELRRLDGVDPR